MSKSFKIDLTGKKFGRLTVLEFVPVQNTKKTYWLCRCVCGNEKIILHGNLTSGTTSSCGCLKKERAIDSHTVHGDRKTRLYSIWNGIKQRCNNKNNHAYENYGGRGICIDPAWNDYTSFRDWALSHGYTDNLSIDRIDVNGNYAPSNCRWADAKTQGNNCRDTIFVKINGKNVTLAQASEISGINVQVLRLRYHRGDRGDRLFRPVKKSK